MLQKPTPWNKYDNIKEKQNTNFNIKYHKCLKCNKALKCKTDYWRSEGFSKR